MNSPCTMLELCLARRVPFDVLTSCKSISRKQACPKHCVKVSLPPKQAPLMDGGFSGCCLRINGSRGFALGVTGWFNSATLLRLLIVI